MVKLLHTVRINTQRIEKAVRRAEGRALKRSGAYIRTIARRSIRYRKHRWKGRKGNKKRNVSEEGKPPFAHVRRGKADIRNILYAYDPKLHMVIIGPEGLRSRAPTPATALQEKGGKAPRRLYGGPKITVRLGKRPYMKPAMIKAIESGKLAEFWQDTVKRY